MPEFFPPFEPQPDDITTDPMTGLDLAPEPETDFLPTIDEISNGMQLQNPLSRYVGRGFVGEKEYYKAEGYDPKLREFTPEKNYSPLDDPQIKGMDPEIFTKSASTQETSFLAKKTKDNQRLLKETSLVGEIAGAIGNPLYYATGWAGGARSVVGIVAREVAAEAVNENILHAQQTLRTKAETAVNLISVGVLTGAFTKAAHVISQKQLNKTLNDVDLSPAPAAEAAIKEHGSLSAAIVAPAPIDPKAPVGVVKPKMVKAMGGTLTSPVTEVLVDSKSNVAKQVIKDLMDPAVETTGAATTSVESAIKQADGDIANMRFGFVEGYKTYRQNGGNLSEDGFNVEVARAMRNKDTHSNKQVASVAKHYRKFDQGYYDQAFKLGMYGDEAAELVGARSHLQRIYNRDSIFQNRVQLKSLIMNKLNAMEGAGEAMVIRITPEEVDALPSFGVIKPEEWPALQAKMGDTVRPMDADMSKVADDLIDSLTGKPGTVEYADVKHAVPKAGSLHERTLSFLDDKELEPFLENNASAIMAITANQMTRSIQMTKKFGSTRMSQQLKEIREDYTDMMNKAKTGDERAKISKRMERDLYIVKSERDLVMGTYGSPEIVGKMVNAGRILRTATLLTSGLNITTSSLNDLAAPALRHGFKPFYQGLKVLSNGRKATKEYTRYVQHLGLAVNSVTNSRAIAFADSTFAGSKEKGALRLFGKFTGLNMFVDVSQGMNAISTSSMWLGYFKKWDKVSPNAKSKLHQMGIDDKMAKRIQAQVELYGKKHNNVMVPESQTWADEGASEAFENALRREVHATTLIPGKGDSPLWSKGETGKFAFMFQSFITSAHSKFLISGMQRMDADFLTGVLMMTALGAMTVAGKDAVRGKDLEDKELEKWIYEGLDRGGVLGLLAPPVGQGMSYMTGKVPSRYAAKRDLAGFFLSPAPAGFGIDVVGSTVGTAQGNEQDAWRMLRLVPFANTLHAVDLLQTMTGNRPDKK